MNGFTPLRARRTPEAVGSLLQESQENWDQTAAQRVAQAPFPLTLVAAMSEAFTGRGCEKPKFKQGAPKGKWHLIV